ncbi:DUF6515 family protein [Microbulbifer yueqingensis]|uniref:Uncharacterized protein n=1 Tax=Microbulbifer yueqingensis TaxID=658219 RepID=A0A1G9CVV6_9GAMM|nr:DUF6515 family protein [Microbulbifer yueqingensis]SDK55772.1 hypothetical protein SAMN05216212_2642 [Microbulbifer yueqingensis]
MKILRFALGAAGLAVLTAFAFAPPADARGAGYDRHGYGHHHYKRHHGPRHWHGRHGPRISLGLAFPVLPAGFVSLGVGGRPYYYHGGHFFRPGPAGYVVVSAPLGASVVSLPGSAVRVEIGGAIYYQYADAYYQWHPARRLYVVVPPPAGVPVAMPAPAPAAPPEPGEPVKGGGPAGVSGAYAPGEVLDSLPVGYTAEVINGVQYYRYGDQYFMPAQRDGREVYVAVQI